MAGETERAGRVEAYRGGMTVHALAAACGVALSTAHAVTRGRVPSVDVALKVSDALGIDLRWYLTGEGQPSAAGARLVEVPLVDHAFQTVGTVAHSSDLVGALGAAVGDVRCLMAHGEAMRPTVPDGAEVLYSCRMDGPPEDGAAYVLSVGGRPVLRRVRAGLDGGWTEVCDNPRFAGGHDVPLSAFVGRVLWVSHRA